MCLYGDWMILVTGAAGYVGGHLINRLLEDEKFADYGIIGIDNFLVGKEENFNLIKKDRRVKLVYGDICDKDIDRLLRDVEIVYHLAAISGVVFCNNNPEEALRVNFWGTMNILEQTLDSVEYFVYPSSAAVYGNISGSVAREEMPPNPLNTYGAMKASCEALCRAYHNSHGIKTTIFRFTNIYGVGTYPKWRTVVVNFIQKALNNKPITIHGSGRQKRDFIHIDDVVEIYKLAINPKANGEVFNAGSGYSISVKELAEIVKRIAEKQGTGVNISFVDAREAKEREFSYDVSKLRSLGFSPKFSIERGVENTFIAVQNLMKKGFEEYQKDIG